MSRPVLDAFDAVKSSSALTCRNNIHPNNIAATTVSSAAAATTSITATAATTTGITANISTPIFNNVSILERLSSSCHDLAPPQLPPQHSSVAVLNVQPILSPNANTGRAVQRLSLSPSGGVARVPKRILLPPLPSSAPRKRSRMNPSHTHGSGMESPGFGLHSVPQPLLPAFPHTLHGLPVNCSSNVDAGLGLAHPLVQQSDLCHHTLPPLQPNTHISLPYSVALSSPYVMQSAQLHPYHHVESQNHGQGLQTHHIERHLQEQGQRRPDHVQPQLHVSHHSDHGLVPTSLLPQSYVDPCSALDLASITHSIPSVPSTQNIFTQPLQHAYQVQQQPQQCQQPQSFQSEQHQHQYQYQLQHAHTDSSLLYNSHQQRDSQLYGQQSLSGQQQLHQQQSNFMPPLHSPLLSRPQLRPTETFGPPQVQPLVMQVPMPDQLATDLLREDVHTKATDTFGDCFNSTWLSDSSSTHDGLTHNVACNNHNGAGIAVDASAARTVFTQQPNATAQHADLKSSLKRNRIAALPSTKSSTIKAAKVAKTLSNTSTGLAVVAKRAIGTGPAKCEDDRDGHLVYKLGQGLHTNRDFPNGRYKILDDLGEGTFGKVVECWDRQESRRVAVKVVRSINKYRQAARLEIDVLLRLNSADPNGMFHCVKLQSWFEFHSHVCMVFEKLGPSLYDQLRQNQFQPFPLDQVRDYAFQLLESINFVHSLTLIHTDLKPENILLASAPDSVTGIVAGGGDVSTDSVGRDIGGTGDSKVSPSNAIKLIDFGSATFEAQHHSPLISTRHYRAPEVILGLGWTYPCDLWSVGCILVELYTGQALFQTHENLEHLAMMSHVLGPIPDSMARRTEGQGLKYFRNKGGRRMLNWPAGASSKASIHMVRRIQTLDNLIRCSKGHDDFLDLVKKLLAFEPDTRCTSAEALRHPFFRNMGRNNWNPQIRAVSAAWHKNAEDWSQFILHRANHCHELERPKHLQDQQRRQQVLMRDQSRPDFNCSEPMLLVRAQDGRLMNNRVEDVNIVSSAERQPFPSLMHSHSNSYMHTQRGNNFTHDDKREKADDGFVDTRGCAVSSLKQDDDNDVGIDRIVNHTW